MFTFITCGFEHSIANMCGLMLGLLLPHGVADHLGRLRLQPRPGHARQHRSAGRVFVAGMYWLGSPKTRAARADMRRAARSGQMESETIDVSGMAPAAA